MKGPATTKSHAGWKHAHFKRDDLASLAKMKPRASKARQIKQAERDVREEKRKHGVSADERLLASKRAKYWP